MRLELTEASCGYNKTCVLEDFSLHVENGEMVCLLGPNGVGKTTLFKSMLGFLPLLAGSVTIDGEDRSAFSPKELARRIGYVPQSHEPPFPFSVMDVVVMGRAAHLKGFASPGREDYRIADEVMDDLGIGHLRDLVYTNLSGGERQMVLIARALAQQPEILVMDEPTANLDYGNQIRVLAAIRQLSRSGLGVLMTSHNPDHAFLCCSRAVLITEDKRILSGLVDEIVTEENLRAAYGIQIRISQIACEEEGVSLKSCVPVLV